MNLLFICVHLPFGLRVAFGDIAPQGSSHKVNPPESFNLSAMVKFVHDDFASFFNGYDVGVAIFNWFNDTMLGVYN